MNKKKENIIVEVLSWVCSAIIIAAIVTFIITNF
jgi:hypothetical protein